MIQLELTAQDIRDLSEALDDPETSEKNKIKLLAIRMHAEGAKSGFIAKCLNLHSNTVTNYLKTYLEIVTPFSLAPKLRMGERWAFSLVLNWPGLAYFVSIEDLFEMARWRAFSK